MPETRRAALYLATALLSGVWTAREMVQRLGEAWEERRPWHRGLAARVRRRFGAERGDLDRATLATFIEADAGFRRAWEQYVASLSPPLAWPDPGPPPPPPPPRWGLPPLPSLAALADWLGVTVGQLEWLADGHRLVAREPDLSRHHYRYRWVSGRRGRARLLAEPRGRLKAVQRRILRGLLEGIPAHEAAHGFRRGRGILSCVSGHAGRDVVVRMDLRQFFTSVAASRVHAVFRAAGYEVEVARLLTGLCTHAVPAEVIRLRPRGPYDPPPTDEPALRRRHLPQGAPTSPGLANLCAYRLDCRLAGLARRLGATYTRYADDLIFSGGPALSGAARRLHVLVAGIALEEGFEVNTRKTRVMRPGVRQTALGLVLNERPNVARADYDRLKAILTNCVRHGPASQNREGHADFRAHLRGRVGHVALVNPARGRRLRELFERIAWEGVGAAPDQS